MPLPAILQRLRPPTPDEVRAVRGYRERVEEVLAGARARCDEWMALRALEPDNARLANTAAVHRWALTRLVERAGHLAAPRPVEHVHRDLLAALGDCARACQLLANGYRFHKSEAVCDGQALLIEAIQGLDEVSRHLSLYGR